MDIIGLISIVDGDFDDGWFRVIGEDDLIGVVGINFEWIVVNDLEIVSAYAVRYQVVGGSEDDMLIDIGKVEEKSTACQKFDLVVDDFFERELDDPVIDRIHVKIVETGVLVVVIVVIFPEAILASPIGVGP